MTRGRGGKARGWPWNSGLCLLCHTCSTVRPSPPSPPTAGVQHANHAADAPALPRLHRRHLRLPVPWCVGAGPAFAGLPGYSRGAGVDVAAWGHRRAAVQSTRSVQQQRVANNSSSVLARQAACVLCPWHARASASPLMQLARARHAATRSPPTPPSPSPSPAPPSPQAALLRLACSATTLASSAPSSRLSRSTSPRGRWGRGGKGWGGKGLACVWGGGQGTGGHV